MRAWSRTGVVLIAWAVACGSPPARRAPTPAPPPEATRAQWDEAWDLVTEFGEPLAELGPWTVENAGAIIVSRKAPGPATVPDDALRAYVEREVASVLPRSVAVKVAVGSGVVHLHGTCPSRQDAGGAVWAVVTARGVDQVVSHLTWPGSELRPPRPRLHEP